MFVVVAKRMLPNGTFLRARVVGTVDSWLKPQGLIAARTLPRVQHNDVIRLVRYNYKRGSKWYHYVSQYFCRRSPGGVGLL